ncbi:MAG TPA: choice-of-anchor V domain-containing protein [Chitinophagaceae bacterium]
MKNKILMAISLMIAIVVLSSYIVTNYNYHPTYSSQPPQGYTGATGAYCTSCHSSYSLNNSGGSVSTTGLPSANYTAGTTYNFSITTTHSVADRKKWGFSIIALNSAGSPVGTFSSTNPNAALNGSELSHFNAVATGS